MERDQGRNSLRRAAYFVLGICAAVLTFAAIEQYRSPEDPYKHGFRALPAAGIGLLALSVLTRERRKVLSQVLLGMSLALADIFFIGLMR